MFRAKIKITLRKSILDAQGKTTQAALRNLGYHSIESVRIGKYIEMELSDEDESEARRKTEEACKKLLANPVMEDYSFEIEKA
ncbi:MAG: phosphoribosylformylglycinamidine synthase subunit PurS [Chloroherpetonaceae bacterium]|nr:phosphoribosylformylglycinamidine synthase subunit PurS [Chloroherpetonaceae bacterium]